MHIVDSISGPYTWELNEEVYRTDVDERYYTSYTKKFLIVHKTSYPHMRLHIYCLLIPGSESLSFVPLTSEDGGEYRCRTVININKGHTCLTNYSSIVTINSKFGS